jgi:hypothetical protein
MAGPKLSRSQLQCALVGAQEVAAENHQKNRPGWPKHNAQALLQPHHPPVNILGGYKFPDAPDVKLREEKEPGFALTASSTKSDDNLDIPDFLKRWWRLHIDEARASVTSSVIGKEFIEWSRIAKKLNGYLPSQSPPWRGSQH